MLTPTLFLIGLGFGAAVILSIASKMFYVWEDPKIIEVEDTLLGANCGGCGFPGCSAAAASVVEGVSGADICVAGGAEIAQGVAKIMGVEIEMKEPEISALSCRYSVEEAETKFNYVGINDCRAAFLFAGGTKECPIGCLGLGTCIKSCPFGALEMGDDGLPVIIKDKCRACGICVEICPKNILHLSSTSTRMIGEYTTDECTTPCQRTCPTGIDIQAYIQQIKIGNYGEAIRIIKEKNPLPLTCGRICPAPCEIECRRNLVDDPVAINFLKRFVADYEMKNGQRIHPYKALEKTGKKVAVIGGGAQGLTTAYYLGCLGHEPTIYEATRKLGGIVRHVIAKSRLPESVLDWEIESILDIGIKTEFEKTIGKDISLDSLLSDGYDAVALASGGLDSRKILRSNVESENIIPGVYLLLDFYKKAKEGIKINVGEKVFIVGAGTSALETAKICREKGAKEICILCPFTNEDLINRGIDIGEARKDGVEFQYSTTVNKLIGSGNKLRNIVFKNTVFGTIEDRIADTLIVATGSLSNLVFVRDMDEETEEYKDTWHTVDTYRLFFDNTNEDLFNIIENPAINDNLAVVKSIGRGRKIARAIHQSLTGKEVKPEKNVITKKSKIINIDHLENVNATIRNSMPKIAGAEEYTESDMLYISTEIDLGFSEDIAKKESERCLECGLICYKKAE